MTDVLLSRFVPDKFHGIVEYARDKLCLDNAGLESMVTDIAIGCLEIGCKGKMLGKLVDACAFLSDVLAAHIVKTYRLSVDDLPAADDESGLKAYSAPLCADFMQRSPQGGPPGMEEEPQEPVPPTGPLLQSAGLPPAAMDIDMSNDVEDAAMDREADAT